MGNTVTVYGSIELDKDHFSRQQADDFADLLEKISDPDIFQFDGGAVGNITGENLWDIDFNATANWNMEKTLIPCAKQWLQNAEYRSIISKYSDIPDAITVTYTQYDPGCDFLGEGRGRLDADGYTETSYKNYEPTKENAELLGLDDVFNFFHDDSEG